MDEGPGLSAGEVGKPVEMSALRITSGAASVFGAAKFAADAGLSIERTKKEYANCAVQNNLRIQNGAGVGQW